MRVLYVEDEKFLAEAVVHLLKKDKIAVDYAEDGEEGLALALKPNYDVIILDIMLPKMSGLDILKIIRKHLQSCISVIWVMNGLFSVFLSDYWHLLLFLASKPVQCVKRNM